jgi:hypothetical protein
VRQDHDGAGPSHIFHLHDSVVAVVDPLDGTISAYADTHDAPVRTASIPVGFHPWRLVRLPGSVAIISEDGHSRIEVARDQAAWPREFAVSEHHASDAAYRIAPLLRTPGGISLQPFRGAGALPIRAIGPYYVASARELERFGDGRRYVLWKEYCLSEPPPEEPDEQRIKVNVYVGRFERDGRLSGLAALPIAVMSRVGFDYATVLPDGTMALLASIVADGKPAVQDLPPRVCEAVALSGGAAEDGGPCAPLGLSAVGGRYLSDRRAQGDRRGRERPGFWRGRSGANASGAAARGDAPANGRVSRPSLDFTRREPAQSVFHDCHARRRDQLPQPVALRAPVRAGTIAHARGNARRALRLGWQRFA